MTSFPRIRMASHSSWISLLLLALTSSAFAADWGYEVNNGPATWSVESPLCNQDSQSPINIYEGDIQTDNPISTPFTYTNYDDRVSMTIENGGHGFVIGISDTKKPEVSGGGLTGTYRVHQFHLHWSNKKNEGSEHKISSKGFSAELHIVHYNTKYPNIGAAINQSDGLAVLGFMLEITGTNNPNYDEMVSLIQRIIKPNSAKVPMSAVTLNSFLPDSFPDFYRYSGSLTTPPCFQSVTWTVFKQTIKISQDQLDAFFELEDKHNKYVLNNARPVMPINDRNVHANFNPDIHWTYHEDNYGPKRWGDFYESCGKTSQSPVNIPSSPASLDTSLGNFTFNKFGDTSGITMTIKNNGHTAQVMLAGSSLPSIQDGGLPTEYEVAQFHFHWGSDSMRGSEHTIDTEKYPMEVHIVTWNKNMGNIGNAVKKSQGLAVLGFFFEVSPTDNPDMAPIVDQMVNIASPKSNTSLPTISLDSFLPADRTQFYRYSGSLTTPACYESVIWSVFNSKIKISEAQLDKFRRLISDVKEEGTANYYNIENNYRPVQFLNSRQIMRNFEVSTPAKVYWTYFGAHGTEHWKDIVPLCGSTKRQSPIDIRPKTVELVNFDAFKFLNFDSTNGLTMKIVNNGHTVVVVYDAGNLQVSGGGLPDPAYYVHQFHFHWGSVNTQGSEHTVDGVKYPMEVHIVTRNMVYSNIGVAISQGNGLAVLGFMFQITDKDNPSLEPIISSLSQIKEPGTNTPLTPFALGSILPKDKRQFYRYYGSLTTPTCDESVTWTVFKSTIPISQAQMNKFRGLKSVEKDDKNNTMPMVDNFRPVQPVGQRTVYSNFIISAGNSNMHAAASTSIVSLLTYVMGFVLS